jgi:hypothetical protein
MIVLPILLALLILNLNAHTVAFINRWPSTRYLNPLCQFLPEIASFGQCCANYDQIKLYRL